MPTNTSSIKPKRERFRPLQRLASFTEWRKEAKNYDLAYYFGPGSRAEPKLLETEEIFYAVAAECEDISYTIFSPDDWRFVNQERRTNEFAPVIEDEFLSKYPQIEGRVSIVYKRSGGWYDSKGRYVPIFKGAKACHRSLDGVLEQSFYKDGIGVNRKSTTCLQDVARDHAKIKKAREAIAARKDIICVPKRLHIIRFSSWEGVKKARKRKPYIFTGKVIKVGGIATLYVVQSARDRDITHNISVRRALFEINPDIVMVADVDRLGREYWKATYNSLKAMGISVTFKDPDWVPDMHLRPITTKIDQQTNALDGVCVVHIQDIDKSKIRKKYLLKSLRRVGDHFLIKREKLWLLGIHPKDLQQKIIGTFGNAFSEIVQISIRPRQSYILSVANAPRLTNRRPPPSIRSPGTKCSLPLRTKPGAAIYYR